MWKTALREVLTKQNNLPAVWHLTGRTLTNIHNKRHWMISLSDLHWITQMKMDVYLKYPEVKKRNCFEFKLPWEQLHHHWCGGTPGNVGHTSQLVWAVWGIRICKYSVKKTIQTDKQKTAFNLIHSDRQTGCIKNKKYFFYRHASGCYLVLFQSYIPGGSGSAWCRKGIWLHWVELFMWHSALVWFRGDLH